MSSVIQLPSVPAIRALDSLERVPPRLVLADPDTARDVQTFVGRSAAAGNDGVRLQARGGILAVTSAALAPRSMFDHTPTVLAMRIVHADPELECDIVVQEVTASEQSHVLLLPDTGLAPSWAGVSPPRSGWAPRGLSMPQRLHSVHSGGSPPSPAAPVRAHQRRRCVRFGHPSGEKPMMTYSRCRGASRSRRTPSVSSPVTNGSPSHSLGAGHV